MQRLRAEQVEGGGGVDAAYVSLEYWDKCKLCCKCHMKRAVASLQFIERHVQVKILMDTELFAAPPPLFVLCYETYNFCSFIMFVLDADLF